MGRYSKAFSIKKQFQSPNCQTCQGQSRTLKKIVFLELLLRIIEEEKWNLFEKLGELRTPNEGITSNKWLPVKMKVLVLLLAANLLVVSSESSLVSFLSSYLNPYLLDYLGPNSEWCYLQPPGTCQEAGGQRTGAFDDYIYQSFVNLVSAYKCLW